MNIYERKEFRRSPKWKRFKRKCRALCDKDYITGKPLVKTWNLHHLDLNVSRYDNLSDIKRFIPLNPKTHTLIHDLYKLYKKDHSSFDRILEVLRKMEEYTNEK